MTSTGKAFENKIRGWHKGIECFTFKFPDHASSGNMQKAICDRVTVTEHGTFWFEMKHTESKTSFAFSLIKDHQWKTMLEIEFFQPLHVYFLIEDGNHNVYMITPSMLSLYKGKSVKFEELVNFKVKKADFKVKIERFIY